MQKYLSGAGESDDDLFDQTNHSFSANHGKDICMCIAGETKVTIRWRGYITMR